MSKTAEISLVPRLRFPEFQGEWQFFYANMLFSQISVKNDQSDLPILAITQEYGAIPRDKIDYNVTVSQKGIENYKVVTKGDFIISLRSFQGGIEFSSYSGLCSPAYVVLRRRIDGIDAFYKFYFKTQLLISDLNKKLEGMRDGKMVTFKQFSDLRLPYPIKEEQEKIAFILSTLDDLISMEGEKLKAYQTHKRGLMHKLFPAEGDSVPQLRFQAFEKNGGWNLITLSDIGELYSGLTGKSGSDFGTGKPYVTYMQVFSNSVVNFNACARVLIAADENQNTLLIGDVLFTTSSETPEQVGYASVVLEEPDDQVYLNSFCFIFRPNDLNILNPNFSRYIFHSSVFRKSINKLAQGAIRYNLSRKSFIKLTIPLPPIGDEQQKVATTLSSIDDMIDLQTQKIEALKLHKKGLLQNLFPTQTTS